MTKGVAAFTMSTNCNQILGVIDPNDSLPIKKRCPDLKVFQFFGIEDTIYNHLHMLHEVNEGREDEIQKLGENALN